MLTCAVIIALASFGVALASPPSAPPLCFVSPMITIQAGDPISLSVENNPSQCVATLSFTDVDFLPIRWSIAPVVCSGNQDARFSVPVEAPNGIAALSWVCTGDSAPSCVQLLVVGGDSNPTNRELDQIATMVCLENAADIISATASVTTSSVITSTITLASLTSTTTTTVTTTLTGSSATPALPNPTSTSTTSPMTVTSPTPATRGPDGMVTSVVRNTPTSAGVPISAVTVASIL